ncbi:MAG: aminopeptidase P family protein [Deltaproteobacteria bacterium]|jgi:Xaa-Pro aminopeptidase|nr:aminopeptidase P family protein [Deltaproteobacteria bacterium]
MAKAHFIYDTSNKNADLYYATKFMAGDPFIFFQFKGKKYMVMNDLEVDRAKKEAKVDHVLSLTHFRKIAEKRSSYPSKYDLMHEIFQDLGVKHLIMPQESSFLLVDEMRQRGYLVEAGPAPFFQERYQKTKEERKYIEQSQKVVFSTIRMVRDVLQKSRIKGNRLVYKGKALSSEAVRSMIDVYLMEKGFIAQETIVSCGKDSVDPHSVGHGLLKPHSSIIVDIFPKSGKTQYYGDATRTFCRGKAPDGLKRMYATVKKGQEMGLGMVKAGISGKKIHDAITTFFTNQGFPTREQKGRMVGFFHGTGHSIGLEVHEEPARINKSDYRLRAGNVFSVEPGLYYPAIGGVRIEDLVYITKGGCEILSGYPKKLEII